MAHANEVTQIAKCATVVGMETSRPKGIKINEFCEFVVRYLAVYGENGLTAALISRQMGVSRSWIYKYFGPKKSDWLGMAAENVAHFISDAGEFSPGVTPQAAMKEWKRTAGRLLQAFEERPWIGLVYFRFMGNAEHTVGRAIQRAEDGFLAKSARNFQTVWKMKPAHAKSYALAFAYYRMVMAHAWAQKGPARHGFSRAAWIEMMVPRPDLET